jgi:hypothetical protein
MNKLIILIGSIADTPDFNDGWPIFLRHAEAMPGLLREATTRVHAKLYGEQDIHMIHELFFESKQDLQVALASPDGNHAGLTLQNITKGQVTLLSADHREDDIENLRKYRSEETNDADAE